LSIAVIAALSAASLMPRAATAAEPDFKGKQIRLMIGSSAGGGYDTFARTIASHWGKHIPGNPTFVPQNMPGPMSLPVANHIYTTAPKDGTVLGAVNPQIASEALLNPDRARFDARQFVWIGSALRESQVMLARSDAPVKTFEDAFKTELIVGGSGGATDTFPTLTNAILGTKFKVVSGYPGTREVNLALERGEVQGNGGITWASVKATMTQMLEKKQITILAQYGLQKHPELPDVPQVLSYAKTPDQQSALLLLFATQEFGRPYIAPPGLPAPVAQALRTSFMATMNDPEFQQVAKQRRLDLDPVGGEDIQKLVEKLYTTSPATIKRVQQVFAADRK
jgi:tripartite-type tricarboxylate transporter receptor subunit TctC